MAFLDNPAIILAHIRQSHVTSDDTGMCEMVLVDQDVDLEKCQLALVPGSSRYGGSASFPEGGGGGDGGLASDPHACDLSQSMDITSSWDFGIRRRSNTGRWAGEAPRRAHVCVCECVWGCLIGAGRLTRLWKLWLDRATPSGCCRRRRVCRLWLRFGAA